MKLFPHFTMYTNNWVREYLDQPLLFSLYVNIPVSISENFQCSLSTWRFFIPANILKIDYGCRRTWIDWPFIATKFQLLITFSNCSIFTFISISGIVHIIKQWNLICWLSARSWSHLGYLQRSAIFSPKEINTKNDCHINFRSLYCIQFVLLIVNF